MRVEHRAESREQRAEGGGHNENKLITKTRNSESTKVMKTKIFRIIFTLECFGFFAMRFATFFYEIMP
jgi:hypothetical protein